MKRQTFIEYSKVIISALTITFVTALFCIIQALVEKQYIDANKEYGVFEQLTVVIDAGHGGEDGGAVGVGGTLEKDINLEIALALYDVFSLTDIDVVLTRDGDYLLYKEGQESRKKFNDLNNRVSICKSYDNPIMLSIHQNKFPLSKYKGLQVYYSKNNGASKTIADAIQTKTSSYLQKDNNRKIKEAGRNIFILDRLDCPAVLIECGFLSNEEDEMNLNDEDYQRKIAFTIFSSLMDYKLGEI